MEQQDAEKKPVAPKATYQKNVPVAVPVMGLLDDINQSLGKQGVTADATAHFTPSRQDIRVNYSPNTDDAKKLVAEAIDKAVADYYGTDEKRAEKEDAQ